MKVQTTISPYVGAKAKFAGNLVQMFPSKGVKEYYSVFGGMANDILAKPRAGQTEHINDLDPVIYSLLKVLCDASKGRKLIKRMCEVPYTEKVFLEARDKTSDEKVFADIADEVEKAVYAWTVLLLSKNGARQSFKGIREGTEEIKFHASFIKRIQLLERLEGIRVTNKDALDVIEQLKQEGRKDIFVYADSPYYGENCSSKKHYVVDMETMDKQTEYLELIADVPFPMMISGYDSSLYKEILEEQYGWKKQLVAIVPKTMRIAKGSKNKVEEYVWMNYKLKKDASAVLTTGNSSVIIPPQLKK